MLAYMERYEPALVDEMRGIAAGAEVPFDTVLDFNTSASVHYIQDFRSATVDGCTNVAFATTAHGPLLGKTNDGGAPVPPERQPDTWVFQHVWPDDGPEYFQLSTLGLLSGVAVMNARGFAVGQSAAQVVPDQDGYGVPTTLILRPLVERCATVEEALALLEGRDLAGKGLNMMLLDAAGTVRAAEKSKDRLGVREPDENGVLFFSNHCHTPGLKELPDRHDRNNSHRRWAHLQSLFAENGARDRERMRRVISGHGSQAEPGGAGEICQHGPQMFTSLGLLVEPRERRLWASDGAPCSTAFVEHRLGDAAPG
jgi:isopenicillin-N N-acyltransferase-like protein